MFEIGNEYYVVTSSFYSSFNNSDIIPFETRKGVLERIDRDISYYCSFDEILIDQNTRDVLSKCSFSRLKNICHKEKVKYKLDKTCNKDTLLYKSDYLYFKPPVDDFCVPKGLVFMTEYEAERCKNIIEIISILMKDEFDSKLYINLYFK